MPPIRRKPPTAARPAARRPKIAGAAQANKAAAAPEEQVADHSAAAEARSATEVTAPGTQGGDQRVESQVPEAATVELPGTEQAAVSLEKDVPETAAAETAAAAPEVAETAAAETEVVETEVVEHGTPAVVPVTPPAAEEAARAGRRRGIPRPRAGWPLVAVLLAIAVVFGAFAGVVAWKQPAKVDNVAYIDDATTTQVTASAKTIVQKIFSYDYKTIDQHAGEIKGDITPAMMDQYNKFFAPSSDAIKQDKSHVDATVDQGNIGVKMLEGDLAQVELILNVTSSNDGVTGQGAQVPLLVNLQRSGDKWTVTGLHQL